jgi:hypothetical protein
MFDTQLGGCSLFISVASTISLTDDKICSCRSDTDGARSRNADRWHPEHHVDRDLEPASRIRVTFAESERHMAIASYQVVGSGGVWRVKHDGEPMGSYPTKEAAFEAAVAAASSAVREGYEVQLSVPGARIEP